MQNENQELLKRVLLNILHFGIFEFWTKILDPILQTWKGSKKFGHPCLINSFELDFEKRRGEILKIVIEKYSNEDALEHYGRSINELNSFQY